MRGAPDRGKGWWITGGWKSGSGNQYASETWSYSWSVSHSLRWYLETSKSGLTAKQTASVSDLQIGDVIFMIFKETVLSIIAPSLQVSEMGFRMCMPIQMIVKIVITSIKFGAYTPNIKYYFYKIDDVFS